MSLLFDANLSPRLVAKLADAFPGSSHVADHGLTLTDVEVWRLAAARGLAIVTKDADFQHLAVFSGEAKVVWIRLGNCRTELVESLLRQRADEVRALLQDAGISLLAIP